MATKPKQPGEKGKVRKDIFGWFDSPEQAKPVHDPGIDTICPFCAYKLSFPIQTISLMKVGDVKSYFYRVHKECYNNATDNEITTIEGSLIDNI